MHEVTVWALSPDTSGVGFRPIGNAAFLEKTRRAHPTNPILIFLSTLLPILLTQFDQQSLSEGVDRPESVRTTEGLDPFAICIYIYIYIYTRISMWLYGAA